MLFNEDFMADSLLLQENRLQYPFLSYTGVHSFQIDPTIAQEVESLMLKIDQEINNCRPDTASIIRLYLQLIFMFANRCYAQQHLDKEALATSGYALFRRFIKLVSRHFMTLRKVSDYANLLHLSADHLNRTIKMHSEKTAGKLIDAMILTEAKTYLLHTELSNAEIAYRLEFSDPSHFNKFF